MIRVILLFFIFPAFALGENIFDKVPTSTIVYGETAQESVVGSFCWHPEGDSHLCADTGLISPNEYMEVLSNSSLILKMPNQKNLRLIQYSFVPVTNEMEKTKGTHGNRYNWEGGTSEIKQLELKKELKIDFQLKPGLYILNVFAWWKNHDDANHGFLINIAP